MTDRLFTPAKFLRFLEQGAERLDKMATTKARREMTKGATIVASAATAARLCVQLPDRSWHRVADARCRVGLTKEEVLASIGLSETARHTIVLSSNDPVAGTVMRNCMRDKFLVCLVDRSETRDSVPVRVVHYHHDDNGWTAHLLQCADVGDMP